MEECRAIDPNSRSPAWKLLEKFPVERLRIKCVQEEIRTVTPEIGRLCTTFCDACEEETVNWFFHCFQCLDSDYDLCPRCYQAEVHCLDRDHYLGEIRCEYGNRSVVSYHSSVKESGFREVFSLG
jgi:hypothetical protein